MVLTPHAPGSGICSFFNLSPSTYALRPALAFMSFVASAIFTAAATDSVYLFPEATKLWINADRGSTRVREGGRARVYV